MSTLHFLNVGKGDCTIIQHNSGRTSLIDICKGNYEPPPRMGSELLAELLGLNNATAGRGNFGMSKKPTNPIAYLKSLGIGRIFRFILTHPDMDHMDGLNAMMNELHVECFWETGVRKQKPNFGEIGPYLEDDWDRYVRMIEGRESGLTVLRNLAGAKFHFANKNENQSAGGDGLHILSPNKNIVEEINRGGEVNDGSYVLLYRSPGGKILIPGDAHDGTWDYVLENYASEIADCSVLFAPHHGRRSGANFSFLDTVRPKITFFGCADSGHLAYDEWRRRDLQVITNNQAGNIVLQSERPSIEVFVENEKFASSLNCDLARKNGQGYTSIGSIPSPLTAVSE
jgi:competence protein ComEC